MNKNGVQMALEKHSTKFFKEIFVKNKQNLIDKHFKI